MDANKIDERPYVYTGDGTGGPSFHSPTIHQLLVAAVHKIARKGFVNKHEAEREREKKNGR